MQELALPSPMGEIVLSTEWAYTFGSADNVRRFPLEVPLAEGSRFQSTLGVSLDGRPIAVVGASGGPTGLHEHSALILDGLLICAVGDSAVAFALSPFRLAWATGADRATCFGLRFDASRRALIAHGELAISRLSTTGDVLWSSGGADIFTGKLTLGSEFIEVGDFYEDLYLFDYATGASKRIKAPDRR